MASAAVTRGDASIFCEANVITEQQSAVPVAAVIIMPFLFPYWFFLELYRINEILEDLSHFQIFCFFR